jgi:hypothetical protein
MKTIRRITAFMLVLIMAFALAASAFAAHKSPVTGYTCYVTTYSQTHGNWYTSGNAGYHILSSGIICSITYDMYYHIRKCTSCGADVGTVLLTCTTTHSVCGDFARTCGSTGF